MKWVRFFPLVRRQILRQRTRSLLTVGGVATAMFLFCVVEAMQTGVREATEVSAQDTTLVVYRENRYCPFTSRLPQYYQPRIEKIAGVESATPMRVLVSNCRASLDVVTFRGVPPSDFVGGYSRRFELLEGSYEDWQRRSDAAILGESLARRRGVKVGDRFSAAGITVYVAGIARSDEPQDRNAAYTHLPFIQETATKGGTGGVVTQFNVQVKDPTRLDQVAQAIDREFASDTEPTATSPEKAFVARAAGDLLQIVGFARWLGVGALVAVFALVANAIVLAIQDRIKEHAILQTVGFQGSDIMRMIVLESLLLGTLGGLLGAGLSFSFLHFQRFSLTMEGLNIEVSSDPNVLIAGFVASALLSLFAGLVPAWRAGRRQITECFRAV